MPVPVRGFIVGAGVLLALAVTPQAQQPQPPPAEKKDPPPARDALSLTSARTIAFETTEGTWMNLDVSPDGKSIVFDLLGDVYTIPIAGGDATRLTSGMSFDIQPAYSPDGKTIAFISDKSGSDNVWLMNADGTKPRPLTRDRERAMAGTAWSPDGEYVLTRRAGRLRMFHRDGGGGADVARPADSTGTGAVFTKDGKWIYFATRPASPGGGGGMAGVNGWEIRRINRATGDVATVTVSPVGAFRPAVSPDGKWLTYGVRLDAKTGLRIRNLDTDEEDWLAFPIDRDNSEFAGVLDALPAYAFTPDGAAVIIATGGTFQRIDVQSRQATPIKFKARVEQPLGPFVYNKVAFSTDPVKVRNVRYANGNRSGGPVVFAALNRIWRMDQGGAPKPLVEQPAAQFQPLLSPDGKSVAFVTWDDEKGGHVWRVPIAGGEPQRLTRHAAYYLFPTWSPDGSKVAFIKEDPAAARNVWSRNSGQIMYVASGGGGDAQYVTSAPSDNRLTFSSDGTRILFAARGSGPAGPPPTEGEPPRATSEFVSVRLDGTDRRVIARIGAETTEVVPSPDGRWVAFTVREDSYLAALPPTPEPPTITETTGPGPVKRVTRDGGIDVHWEDGGRTLGWVFGNRLFHIARERVMAQPAAAAQEGQDADKPQAAPAKPPELPKPEEITITLTAPRRTASGTIALKGANVITMKGTEVIRNATVLVKNNRIAEVGKNVRIPADARVVDVSGKWIIPGFIDMHAHLRPPRDVFVQNSWSYEANLAYGVTTTRDVSTSNDSFGYSELVDAGLILGPRIFTTGRAITTSNAKIESLDDARSMVRHYKQLGANVIKQYMQPHRRQRQWVVQAAREEGLNATNEGGGDLRLDLTMVLDGYTGFEHALPQADLYNDVRTLIAQSKTWYTPTLVVAYGGPTAEWYFYQTTNVHDDAKLRRFTPHEIVDRRTRRGQMNALDEYHFIAVAKNAANILKAGGNVAMGAHGEEQGICAHWEIWAMQMGGMTNYDALRTATTIAAEGLGASADLGTVEAGKFADMVVLNKNPLENIRNTNSIALVMRNGDLFDGDSLDMLWPEKKPFRPARFREYTVPAPKPNTTSSPTTAPSTQARRPRQ